MATRDGPLWLVLAAVGSGAALGAWLRWALAYGLNARMPQLPLGTLAANLLGAYLIGIAVAVFALHPATPPAWRLFVVTGLLGGLTTYSTFTAESLALLQGGQFGPALLHSAAHLLGCLVGAALGMGTVRALG